MDLKLIETGSGGDIVFNGSDIEVIGGFQNMPYLGMYGGNIQQNTKEYLPNEQRFDHWGNNLLMLKNENIQFNSDLERLLLDVALTSSSRIEIEETIKSDLSFMDDFATLEVSASILSSDRLQIYIKITQPDVEQSEEFVYIWDATKNELTNG
tara:strand:+ start:74 stop:532 length:459 start_codon:yes stop_codon:yes gene_type:complete